MEGFAENFLFFRRERQIRRIDHRRVVKAPLQNVVGDETGGANGRLARLDDGLLAVGQQQHGLFVAKPDLAVNHGQRRAFRFVHAMTNSVPSTPATAPRVMTRMRPGLSR